MNSQDLKRPDRLYESNSKNIKKIPRFSCRDRKGGFLYTVAP